MKKKLLIIGICIIVILVITAIIYIFFYQKNKNNIKKEEKSIVKKEKKEKCISFTGGAFNIFFNTNGGNEIENMHVGIAVSPDSYQDLPTPVKEGYKFEGWYYDKEFTNKVEVKNSKDIKPIPEYNKNNCMIGYKDIELYANWTEEQLKQVETPQIVEQVVPNAPVIENNQETIQNIENNTLQTETTIYMPSEAGKVLSYMRYQNRTLNPYTIGTTYASFLYPINDGEFIAQGINAISFYYIYKTTINEEPFFVMYDMDINNKQVNNSMKFVKSTEEYSIDRTIKYNEPIVRLDSNKYHVKIIKAIDIPIGLVLSRMAPSKDWINPNIFFKLQEGEEFESKR